MTEIPLYEWRISSIVHFVKAYKVESPAEVDDTYSGVNCVTETVWWRGTCALPYPIHSDTLEISCEQVGEIHNDTIKAKSTSCQLLRLGDWIGIANFEQWFLHVDDIEPYVSYESERWNQMPNAMFLPSWDEDGSQHEYFARFAENKDVHMDFATSLAAIGNSVEGWEVDTLRLFMSQERNMDVITPIVQ